MIEQDLLGISVNDLIENYCVLYDEREKKSIGITTIDNAEKIDKTYGNKYEERYVFLDIFATDFDTIKSGKVLSYYEVQKHLEEFIGWQPDPKILAEVANCVHNDWSLWSKETTQHIINMMKIIKAHQPVLDTQEIDQINNAKKDIDLWQKKWHPFWVLDEESQIESLKTALKILKTLKDLEEC